MIGRVLDTQNKRPYRKLVGNRQATMILLLRGLRQDGETGSSDFIAVGPSVERHGRVHTSTHV